jgi:hypothetical protein
MANFLRITALIAVLAVRGTADSSAVRPLPETRDTRPFPAVDAAGHTFVTTREVKVELGTSDGRTIVGRLGIIFDPSTGFFFHQVSLYHEFLPWRDYLSSSARIGLSADRLIVVTFGNGVGILESTEKAADINEAEAKALQWIGDHLNEPETRSYRSAVIRVARWDFPKDFFQSEIDSSPVPPAKLVDMLAHDSGWDLILESVDGDAKVGPKKASVFIFRQGEMWVRNKVNPFESPKAP